MQKVIVGVIVVVLASEIECAAEAARVMPEETVGVAKGAGEVKRQARVSSRIIRC